MTLKRVHAFFDKVPRFFVALHDREIRSRYICQEPYKVVLVSSGKLKCVITFLLVIAIQFVVQNVIKVAGHIVHFVRDGPYLTARKQLVEIGCLTVISLNYASRVVGSDFRQGILYF